jgi:predicted transglutaminase-like cysteine proteinase
MGEASVVTPPLGYIDFCARFPDQCGPETRRMATAMNTAGGTNAVASRKYFWLTAFDGATPNSVGTRRGAAPDGANYDWRAIFHTTPGADATQAKARAEPAVYQPQTAAALQPASTPHMTKELWSLLERVNQDVNTKIRPVHDIEQFGFEDYWTLPIATGTMAGDCKDYVLEKRRILMAAGLPMPALSITLGTTAWGEYHAVLLVHTTEGDYVLDNLSPWVTPWKDVTYVWSKRQSTENPDIWVRPFEN